MNARAQGASPAATSDRSPALAGAWAGLTIVLLVARAWLLHDAAQRGAAHASLLWLVVAAYQDVLLVVALALLASFAARRLRGAARRALVIAAVAGAGVQGHGRELPSSGAPARRPSGDRGMPTSCRCS